MACDPGSCACGARRHRSKRILGPAAAILALGLVVGAAHSVIQPVKLRMDETGPTIIRIPADQTGDPEQTGTPAVQGDQPAPGPEITLEQFITLDQARMLHEATTFPVAFIDARHIEEYVQGHIARAHNYDPRSRGRGIPDWAYYYDQTSTVFVIYCGGGDCADSENAARDMQLMGFQRVHIFKDGFPAWQGAGLPVEQGRPPEPGFPSITPSGGSSGAGGS